MFQYGLGADSLGWVFKATATVLDLLAPGFCFVKCASYEGRRSEDGPVFIRAAASKDGSFHQGGPAISPKDRNPDLKSRMGEDTKQKGPKNL